MSVRNSIVDCCFLPIMQRLGRAVIVLDTTEPDRGECEADEEMSHQQNLHDVVAGAGVAAGRSCTTDQDENHGQGYYVGKPCNRRRSSVSSITNDCVPISYHETGLIGYSSYHGDEEYIFNSSAPPPVEAEDTDSTSCQVKVQQKRSQNNHNELAFGNGDFDHPNTITINPSLNSNPAAPHQTQRRMNMEGGIQYRAGRLPWYHMSNQYHFKTHPNTDPTISSTPTMTPERNSLCANAWKQHCTDINDSSVGIADKVPGAATVHSFPGSNLPFKQTEKGRQLVLASFEGASNVESDSLGCTIGSSTTHSGGAGFRSFVYRKVKDSSRQKKIIFGLIAFMLVAAFSAAVVELLEITYSHSDRSMNPTFVPENDFAEHSPSTGPRLLITG